MRTFIVAMLLVLSGMTSCAPSHAAEEPTLDEIAEILRQWRRSFTTIQVAWHSWNREHFEARFSEVKELKELDGRFYIKQKWAWAENGILYRDMWHYESDHQVYHFMTGTDGRQPYRASSKYDGNQDGWDELHLHPKSSSQKTGFGMEPLFQVWNQGSNGEWLGEMLSAENGYSLNGYETRDGTRCAVLTFTRPSLSPEVKHPATTIWLDCEHGFLPRWTEQDFSKLGIPNAGDLFKYTVAEFQRLENAIWFPFHGFLKSSTDREPGMEWVVKEVTVNAPLNPADYGPPKPTVGTKVFDYANNYTYRHGAEQPTSPPLDVAPVNADGAPVSAKPNDRNGLWILVSFVSCAVAMTTAGWLKWRKHK